MGTNNEVISSIPFNSNSHGKGNSSSVALAESNNKEYTSNVCYKDSQFSSKFVSRLLNSFNDPNNILINNEQSKRTIENIIIEEFESVFGGNTNKFIAGGVNTGLLTPILTKYILDKEFLIRKYINNLVKEQEDVIKDNKNRDKFDKLLMANIITSIHHEGFIWNLCLHQFLLVFTFSNTDNDSNYTLLPVSITIAKKMFIKYINILRANDYKVNGQTVKYSEWLDKWKDKNPEFAKYLEDNFYAHMGCKIIDILKYSDLVGMKLISSSGKEHPYHVLYIIDNNLIYNENKQSIINLPSKLPMISKPKPYDKNVLGGYLLNDEKF